jgi:predicted dehydrogenase/threonine dehydrogenase-like Zn-dependent dehydrogenase
MRQVIQNISNGNLCTVEVPAPMVQPGQVLIQNHCSLISAGTEKTARDLAKKSLLGKARERPDHLRRVLEKVRQEGLWNTVRQVREKLDDPMPMGYCSAGIVLACGAGVQQFKPGDRVASNGPHAEVVSIPENLCARVSDDVTSEQAAFTVLGAIAMQGVRLSQIALGETALVIGLGLVGQITVALLKAAGATVFGTDLDPGKCELAKQMGADVARTGLPATEVQEMTNDQGADAVLITASTDSDAPVTLAGDAVRKKGRIVAVGAVGMNLPRRAYYFKEAEFVVSCSYGPGRYDPQYEDYGQDYPAAYVRWTEQRNMQAVLDLVANDRVDFSPLVSHRFSIDHAADAYALIESGGEPYLGIMLQYPTKPCTTRSETFAVNSRSAKPGQIGAGLLGMGNFARMTLLPAMQQTGAFRPEIVCSAGGLSATHHGKKNKFARVTNDETSVMQNSRVDAAFILTRHDQHARQVAAALRANKHVFVEKPLCLNRRELAEIEQLLDDLGERAGHLMVGFNRRFSPSAQAIRECFENVSQPLTVSVRMNAGAIESDHWIQSESIGGGRIVGEACHAIDLSTFLTGSPVVRVHAEAIGGLHAPEITEDQCFITLRHANGSISNVAYLAGGDRAMPKERVEVIGGGKSAVIDDFRRADLWSSGKRKTLWRGRQDKGHCAELQAFASAIQTGSASPIPWSDIHATTLASILAVQSIREGAPIDVSTTAVTELRPMTIRRAG